MENAQVLLVPVTIHETRALHGELPTRIQTKSIENKTRQHVLILDLADSAPLARNKP
jgi:hypothetical protein